MQRNLRLLFRAANAGLLRSLLHSHSAFSAALGIVKRACLCSRWNENSHGCHPSSHVVLSPQATKAASRLPAHRGLSRRHSDTHGYLRLSSATPRCAYITPKGKEDRPPPADVKGNVIDPTRNVEIAVLTNTPSVSPLRPQSSPTPSIFVQGCASLRCE